MKNIQPYIFFAVLFFFLFCVKPTLATVCSPTPSGNIFTQTGSCSFSGTVDGVDYGTGTANTAVLRPAVGTTITISGQTIAAGSLDVKNAGSVVFAGGGSFKPGAALWMTDSDSDHIPASTTKTISTTDPGGGTKRLNTITTPTSVDCNDSLSGYQNTLPNNYYYPDSDLDTYTTAQTSASGAVCSNSTTWDASTSVSIPGNGSVYASFTAGTRKAAAKGSDCNDSPTGTTANADKVWYSHTQCSVDADGDTFTNGLQANSTCLGAAGNDTPSCAQATARSLSGAGNAVTASLTAGRMRDAASSQTDCNDAFTNNQYTLSSSYYVDNDLDTYTSGSGLIPGTACSTSSTWDASTQFSYPGAGVDALTYTAGTYKNAANLASGHNDCNDGNGNVYQTTTCYVDGDNDGYGSATGYACIGVPGHGAVSCATTNLYGSAASDGAGVTGPIANVSANNTDCNDAAAGVHTFTAAGGGDLILDNGTYLFNQFSTTGSQTFTWNGGTASVTVQQIGGGGAGGACGGGGGGSGAYDAYTDSLTPGGYTVVVGAGGAGGVSASGANGGASSFDGHSDGGGGGGGLWGAGGKAGACGGGAGGAGGLSGGVANNGFNGGASVWPSGGGGGGVGAVGVAGTSSKGGNGGAGVASAFLGTVGGGGGGGVYSTTATIGVGKAGGSNGTNGNGPAASAATATTGAGGGGGGYAFGPGTCYAGGHGGSGGVVIRYPECH